MLYLLH